jgi:hypothetical protein
VEFDETEHLNQLTHGEPVEPRCLPRQCFNMQSFDRLRTNGGGVIPASNRHSCEGSNPLGKLG